MTQANPNPREAAICPVCHGSGRKPAGDGPYRRFSPGYTAEDNTCDCGNCGAQYMFSSPTGRVPVRPDGSPCHHEYRVEQYSNRACLTDYVCLHCGDRYQIDSGD